MRVRDLSMRLPDDLQAALKRYASAAPSPSPASRSSPGAAARAPGMWALASRSLSSFGAVALALAGLSLLLAAALYAAFRLKRWRARRSAHEVRARLLLADVLADAGAGAGVGSWSPSRVCCVGVVLCCVGRAMQMLVL